MNLPNQITLGRLVLTGLFVLVLTWAGPWAWTAGAYLFIVAAISDYFDGYYARKHKLVTNFGALMDPLVDKVLICSAFVLLACHGQIAGWVVTLVVAREFLVTGLRLVAASQGLVLSADKGGKWKTGAQIATAIYHLMWLAAKEPSMAWFGPFFALPGFGPGGMGLTFTVLAVVSTVWSGLRYMINNRHVIKDV